MGYNFASLIKDIFAKAQAFADGDAGDFGLLIFSTILVMQAVTGGAELLTGSDCRLKKGGFWVRLGIVIFCAFAFDSIFINPPRIVATAAMGDYFSIWKTIWSQTITTIYNGIESWIKFWMAGNTLGVGGLLSASWATMIKAGVGVGCLIVAIVASLFSVVFMLAQAFMATGMAAFVSACAPVFLPFLAAEETQEMGYSYLRTWLVVSMLFLPLLQLGVQISATITNGVFVAFASQPTNLQDAIQQMLMMALGPLAGVGVLLGVPAAIRALK